MTAPPAIASFDPAPDGYRFTLRYEPTADVARRGTVILAPPFAEEMNRCRRMMALCSRRLARSGWRVIVRDLLGCGDSSGDFGDATWQDWIDDLKQLLGEAHSTEALWLWGVRAGALLLPELLAERPEANVLLWQPVTSGRTALNQFLRVKVAAAAIGGKDRVDAKGLRSALHAGRSIEIAGYTISAALAEGMDSSALALPRTFSGRVVWIEVSPLDPPSLTAAGVELCREWRDRAVPLATEAVPGEMFWQTQETAECEAILTATLAHLVDVNTPGGSTRSRHDDERVASVEVGLPGAERT